jgi:hypothetical protein
VKLREVVATAIEPALALLPAAMDSKPARVELLGIGLQESRLVARRQLVGDPPKPIGPAKGLWQFERGGGCKGVITHPASRYWMSIVCQARGVDFNATALWNALEHDDVLAAAAARLLLFTDPRRLPEVDDERGAWNLYLRVWRPGKPHPSTWPALHAAAVAEVMAA